MKTFIFFLLTITGAAMARAGAFDELSLGRSGQDGLEVPAPVLAEADGQRGVPAACPAAMKGDVSYPCVITTGKTTVCADGKKISTARIDVKEVKTGKFSAADLGKYKDDGLREWAEHQEKLGKDNKWGDGSHQNMLATGTVDPLKTAYVVLPNRAWLGRSVTVCLAGTVNCVEARALEVGPKTTFQDHSEVSVRVLMDLGLDANPNNGTYTGQITFTFH